MSMSQQQLGALALIALGILMAAGSGGAAVRRHRLRSRSRESLWSRVLVTLATAGLAVGFVALGAYYYGPMSSRQAWLAQVAEAGFVAAIIGYGVTMLPAIRRMLSAN